MPDEFVTKDSGKREEFNTGAVRDQREGKGRYDLISPLALKRLAGVYERGAVKYGNDRNWEKGMPISRTLDSCLRHVYQYISGMRDEDHLAQAAWNLFAAIHYEECIKQGTLPPELADTVSYFKDEPNILTKTGCEGCACGDRTCETEVKDERVCEETPLTIKTSSD